jgi:hypothetical protein
VSISSHTNQAAALWAIQDAARVLTVDREHAQVFLEERTDLRLEVGSGIPRVCSITRSRGAALGDERSSLHLTDPTPDDLVVAARRMSASRRGPITGLRPPSGSSTRAGSTRSRPARCATSKPRLSVFLR